jgi:hypothetical protein
MTLSEYSDLVRKDCVIRKDEIDEESSKNFPLHNKYLLFYLDENKKLAAMKRAFESLRHEKRLYYLGKADEEVYKAKPFPLLVKPIKSEVEEWINTDDEVQAADAALSDQEAIVKYLNDTLKCIHNRGYDIRAIIDWQKFINGLNN